MIKNKIKRQLGFTVFEVTVSIALFTIIIMLTGSMYTLSQRSYNKGSTNAELSQNARVSLDRLSREVRQSIEVVSILPLTDTDPMNPPVDEIFFQDGHEADDVRYIRYYLDGTNLKRLIVVYYFEIEPSNYVFYNSLDEDSDPPVELIVEDRDVGEYFNDLDFWGNDEFVYISMSLAKGNETLDIRTGISSRN